MFKMPCNIYKSYQASIQDCITSFITQGRELKDLELIIQGSNTYIRDIFGNRYYKINIVYLEKTVKITLELINDELI